MVTGKVLITGVSGLLGGYLFRRLSLELGDSNVVGTWCHTPVYLDQTFQLEITNYPAVCDVVERVKPKVIVHCAAIGSVDYCEKNWAHSYAVNVEGTSGIAAAAHNVGAKFVFISSNAVYAGDSPPYKEGMKRTPVNKYGWQKVEAEDELVEHMPEKKLLIVRPIMLYGATTHLLGRGNWATTLIKAFSEDKTMYMVHDVITQPTYAYDCAETIWALMHMDCVGDWNVGGMDRMTLYDMAKTVAEVWGFSKELAKPVPSSHYPNMAPRPQNTTYDMAKLYGLADEHPAMARYLMPRSVERGLRALKDELA